MKNASRRSETSSHATGANFSRVTFIIEFNYTMSKDTIKRSFGLFFVRLCHAIYSMDELSDLLLVEPRGDLIL